MSLKRAPESECFPEPFLQYPCGSWGNPYLRPIPSARRPPLFDSRMDGIIFFPSVCYKCGRSAGKPYRSAWLSCTVHLPIPFPLTPFGAVQQTFSMAFSPLKCRKQLFRSYATHGEPGLPAERAGEKRQIPIPGDHLLDGGGVQFLNPCYFVCKSISIRIKK